VKKNNKNITETTLLSYLKGTLTIEEANTIQEWINASETNKKQFTEIKKVWEYAASINDFQSIDARQDWQNVKAKMKFEKDEITVSKVRNLSGLQWFVRIAAIFILFTGLAYAIFNYSDVFNFGKTDMIVLATGDKKTEIVLSDGSKVSLNKNSQLTYPKQFSNKLRKVKLKGEGYFEISENKKKPFVVETGNQAVIKVLGTEFNIKNEQIDNEVKLHVLNGKVAFFQSGKEDNRLIITKKQQAVLTKKGFTKSETTNPNFISWKTGILIFENDPVEKVAQDLSNHYQKNILLEYKSNKKYKITSTFDNEELKNVLEEIKLILNAEYKIENDRVTFYLE